MQIGMTSERNSYREFVRRIAAVLAFLFAFVAVAASLHHHGGVAKPVQPTLIERVIVSVGNVVTTITATSDPRSFFATDCVLCDWMMTIAHPATVVEPLLFAVFSSVASLLLMVRLAALCAIPAPRRGLRAPPALCHG